MTEPIDWTELERIIRRDPGGRGVASYRHDGSLLLEGHLRAAAEHLAAPAKAVAIVTGFAIVTTDGVAAETDGPPGALFLACTLRDLGIEAVLLSDAYGVPVLEVGCLQIGLPRELVHAVPFEHADPSHPSRRSNDSPHNEKTDQWVETFLASDLGRRLTHVIAIERVGPSHVGWAVPTKDGPNDPWVGTAHPTDIPSASQNLCHNMRGEDINAHTAKSHRLFEMIQERRLPITTIGIGDGGNEIGMGSIPREVLRQAITRGPAERVACRIATTWAILAGVSNWGGYALALATAALKDPTVLPRLPDETAIRDLIQALVRHSFCVDGVTKRPEASVDGLSLDDYLAAFRMIRSAVPIR